MYPNGDVTTSTSNDEYDRHISLYLVSAEDDISSYGLEINVMITFLVYGNLKDKYWSIQGNIFSNWFIIALVSNFDSTVIDMQIER